VAADLEVQLRREIGLGHLIARGDLHVVSAARRKRRNIKMMQKFRVPVFVLPRYRLGNLTCGVGNQRNTVRIGHLHLPGKLYAALLVSGGGDLVTAKLAAEEYGFAG